MNMTGFNPVLGGARRWDFLASLLGGHHASDCALHRAPALPVGECDCGAKKVTFVEVGCKEGRTTGHVLKTCPLAQVIAIDPWAAQPQMAAEDRGETYEKWDFAKIEADFWENVGEHKERCRMLRMTSLEAAAQEVGGELDLVFIDAAHDYASVTEDINAWWPLVKAGGILAGHDFNHKWPTIERAIADAFPLMQVGVGPDSVWFVLKQEGAIKHG